MIVLHKALRREFALLPELVAAVPAGDTGRAQQIGRDPRTQLCLLGGLLEDATPSQQQQQAIYAQMPAAARILWTTAGVRLYRRYVTRIRAA